MLAGLSRTGDPSHSHAHPAELLLDFKLHPHWNSGHGSSRLFGHPAGGQRLLPPLTLSQFIDQIYLFFCDDLLFGSCLKLMCLLYSKNVLNM